MQLKRKNEAQGYIREPQSMKRTHPPLLALAEEEGMSQEIETASRN